MGMQNQQNFHEVFAFGVSDGCCDVVPTFGEATL